ncbi:hypothetical protein [Spirosoma utsteinense]|uniref:Sortilin N-terminal domain-containing protein n=1 Tax=Spirosoma utsteinense TaxID=2585773 RepID=A0ABR6WF94_9BACT|nr:hypothetical protein [Spirosoma utsteinense]MBC3795202.1 hypothetical protein [Spirosoma utsteinense]
MRKSSLLLLALTVASSCTNNNIQNVTPHVIREDPDWIRLEIPKGREAYAIAGDIDKTLLVTTWTKAYYTTDRGKTWKESKNFNGPVPGLLVRNDTTFSMEARAFSQQGDLVGANIVNYFTANYGETWESYFKYYKEYLSEIKPIGRVKSTKGSIYYIKSNSTPTAAGSSSAYVNPSEVIREDSRGQQAIPFPFKQNLLNLHIDVQNRLYIAASGGTYQSENNTFSCCADDMSAIIFISKKPVP